MVKRFWFGLLAMALVFGMTVAGCDNNTSPGSWRQDIIGIWESLDFPGGWITFNSNGTFQFQEQNHGDMFNGTFDISGNMLTLWEQGEPTVGTFSLSNNNNILTINWQGGVRETFARRETAPDIGGSPPTTPPLGDNGTVPDPPEDPWRPPVPGAPFVQMHQIIGYRGATITQNAIVGSAAGGSEFFGIIRIPDSFTQTDAGNFRWVSSPPGASLIPPGSLSMSASSRVHDYDGIFICMDSLNRALQGVGTFAAAGPMLGQANAVGLLVGDVLTITGRITAVSAGGNRRINLVRDLSGDWSNIEILTDNDLRSDMLFGEAFTLQWSISGGSNMFGRIGIITEGWAGNNLHASGVIEVIVDSLSIRSP